MKKPCYYVVEVGDKMVAASMKYEYAMYLYYALFQIYPDDVVCIVERDCVPGEVLVL